MNNIQDVTSFLNIEKNTQFKKCTKDLPFILALWWSIFSSLFIVGDFVTSHHQSFFFKMLIQLSKTEIFFKKTSLQFQVDLNIRMHHVQLLEAEIVCNAHITCTTKLPLDNQKSKNGVVALRKLC